MDLDTARQFAAILAEADGPPDIVDATEPPEIKDVEVGHLLGAGSGGRVWFGRMPSGTPVAVKHLRQGFRTKSSERGWRELEVLEELDLPFVPRLLDYGTDRGRLYFVTEFVEGEPVDRYASGQGLDPHGRVELLAAVAAAVAGLHEQGVLHRDLKPSNVLITCEGEPRIIDLGLASFLEAPPGATITEPQSVLGTPAYMAPEQARGELGAVGTRSDVYALGAIGYTLLTGQPPHDLTDLSLYEALRVVGESPARRPRSLDARLPRPLAAVLETACARYPKHRYASASELDSDLRRWLRGEPVLAGEPTPWLRLSRWIARRPFAATWVLCALIMLSTALISWGVVSVLTSEPVDFFVSDSGNVVFIKSRANTRIGGVFEPANPSSRLLAYRVDGGEVDPSWFLLIHGNTRDPLGFPELAMVNPRQPTEPAWYFPDRMTPPDRMQLNGEIEIGKPFTPMVPDHLIRVWDLYPEEPGDEIIVAVRNNSDLHTRLCVLNVTGELLASVWYAGHIHSIWPIGSDGRVVFTATLHTGESIWHGHVPLIGMIDLTPARVVDRWVSHGSDHSESDLIWALRATPTGLSAEDLGDPIFHLTGPNPAYAPGSIAIGLHPDDADLRKLQKFWHLDRDGMLVGEAYLSDEAASDGELRPALNAVDLVPVPSFDPNIPR